MKLENGRDLSIHVTPSQTSFHLIEACADHVAAVHLYPYPERDEFVYRVTFHGSGAIHVAEHQTKTLGDSFSPFEDGGEIAAYMDALLTGAIAEHSKGASCRRCGASPLQPGREPSCHECGA